MAETEYEQLETVFQSDLQSMDMQNDDGGSDVPPHLPEWLIGVIVVVILLIIAFFAMVVYSLMKERKRTRAGIYAGTASTTSAGENVETGKTDGNIRITAFSLEQQPADTDSAANGQAGNGANGSAWTLDAEVASTLQRRQHGPSGCKNPAFIDDDDAENDGNKDSKAKKDIKQNGKLINDEETGENNDDDGETKTDQKQNRKVVNDKKSSENNKDEKAKTDSKGNRQATNDKNSEKGTNDNTNKATTEPKSASHSKSRSMSPKSSSKSDSSKKGSETEEVEMVEHPSGRSNDGEEAQLGRRSSRQSSGDGKEREESESVHSSTADQETTVDEAEENGQSGEKEREEGEEHQSGSESIPEESCSSGGSQTLEVVMDRDGSSPDPQLCVTMHRDPQEEGEQEKDVDSSADEADDGPGTSTNL